MRSETNDVQQIFQDRRQYRVPFYQRAYVWAKEEQWEPLWNDIRDKAEVRAVGETPTPHFLGAIVLEPQPRRGLKGVETYNIIDGQQRMTTLQYFLAALSISIGTDPTSSILPLLQGCVWNSNPNTMENPDVERFKVWPTFRDRTRYRVALQATNRNDLRVEFPTSFTQGGTLKKVGIDHPAALEAIWFFCDQIESWCAEQGAAQDRSLKIQGLAEAVLRDLKVVSISLEEGDDAQVIFETLNGRGAELHATDLIRNFIFMRADREDADSQSLYDTLWTPFEGTFWTETQRRGRLKRPRLEWFVQTALQAELGDVVEVGRLYTDYRRYVNQKPPVKAENQLNMLAKHSSNYHQLTSGSGADPIARFGQRIAIWDVSPTHALALRVASVGLSVEIQTRIFDDIVSFIVRRAMCGLTTKNYNNVFLLLLKILTADTTTSESFYNSLSAQRGDASRWPGDDEFKQAWIRGRVHQRLGDSARVRTVLSELENGLRSARTEAAFAPGEVPLDVDHILPEKWYAHWPLDGRTITEEEAASAAALSFGLENPTPQVQAIITREELKATIGNLTLVHYGINRSLQNGAFPSKSKAFFAESNLQLNRPLMVADHWDEATILERGNDLFEVARLIWRGPAPPVKP